MKKNVKTYLALLKKFGCHSSGGISITWDYFREGQPESYVEIGVKAGWNAIRMVQRWEGTKVYLVDPWTAYDNEPEQYVNDMNYESTVEKFKWNKDVTIIRKTSVETAKLLSDKQFDIVFIDGNHKFKFVVDDIKAWLPLVKKGGMLCGHDYSHREVMLAVKSVFKSKHFYTGKGAGDVWVHIKGEDGDVILPETDNPEPLKAIAKPKVNNNKHVIAMVASKPKFHLSAFLAGATFRKALGKKIPIRVYIPEGEDIKGVHDKIRKDYTIEIRRFKFARNKDLRYATQLNAQGYLAIVKDLLKGQVALIGDSDIYCVRPFEFPEEIDKNVAKGNIVMVKEPWNRYDSHHGNPDRFDFIPEDKRLTYVNSGVMFASLKEKDMFEKFVEYSKMPEFSLGPFHDQTIINYSLCMDFPDRIRYIDNKYNGICTTKKDTTIIGHNGQGIGIGLGEGSRHYCVTNAILNDEDWFKVFKSFDKKKGRIGD